VRTGPGQAPLAEAIVICYSSRMDTERSAPKTPVELARMIDLTLLRPDAAELEVRSFLAASTARGYASVCVPPCYVRLASKLISPSGGRVCTVAGFPMGFQATGIKLYEAVSAVKNGAVEVDVVMNISEFKSGKGSEVEAELASIVRSVPGVAVKVIIECCYLTDGEKERAVELVVASGAHFVKTSTGVGPGGATVDDVRLLAGAAAGRVKVKAAGGIRDLDSALELIGAGAERIGTSAGAAIVDEFERRAQQG